MQQEKYIDKTTYLEYLQCPKNTWLKLHKPELHGLFESSGFEKNLSVSGKLVESWAEKLFPAGVKTATFKQKHIQLKTPVLFQPTFVFEQFLIRCDILAWDQEQNAWNLYEIKATNSLGENTKQIDHIADVSFQAVILGKSAIPLGKIFIVHLNKDYVRGDILEVEKLFLMEDVTDKVQARQTQTEKEMRQAKLDLLEKQEKDLTCPCLYCGRNSQCTTFKYSHPEVPEYSVHDLARIGTSKQKLANLVGRGIFRIEDIPDDFELSAIQKNQVAACKTNQPLININAIRDEIADLNFPLYFLDYETYASAIPMFKGFRPYQQVPFQFSLHVLNGLGQETENYEYLNEDKFDPSDIIISELRSLIGPLGSIIVWNQSFEKKINQELAERHPEHKEFLENINSRVYDLMDIFRAQFYVHPAFCGRTSIKKVLPVLAPELSYLELQIQEGATASQKWYDMVFGPLVPSEKEKILQDLMDYCGLDTLAMFAIWKFLMTMINKLEKLPLVEARLSNLV